MEWVKTTAKTLPEAIDLALDNLGVDEAEAEIKVLEEPKHGLFGRIKGTARVEARVKPKPIRPKTASGRPGRSGNRSRNNSRNDNRSSSRNGRNSDNRRQDNKKPRGNDSQRSSQKNRKDRNSHGSDSPNQDNNNKKVRNQDRSTKSRNGGSSRRNSEEPQKENRMRNEHSQDEVSSHLTEFLEGLSTAFGFEDSKTEVVDVEGALEANITGQHGLLVGPKGRTLDAVQELSRVSAQCRVPSDIRIRVDVGGYRAKRSELVVRLL